MRTTHWIGLLILAGVLGLSLFGYLALRATTSEPAEASVARARMAEIRESLGHDPPMIEIDHAGQARRRDQEKDAHPDPVHHLYVLVYRSAKQELVQTRIPFWFIRLKGPAFQFLLKGSDLDLKRLGITIKDLEGNGPGLVLDASRAGGDHVLVWLD